MRCTAHGEDVYPRFLDGIFKTPHDAPPKWLWVLTTLSMYTAYLDETGQETDGWIFVAGFLGNEKQWESFIPRWKEALGPQRKRLHMHKLRWKSHATKNLLARLGPVPQECGLKGVVGGVRYSDYEDLVKGTIVEKLSEGYLWSLFPLVQTMLKYIPRDDRVELIFGEQMEYRERAHELLSFIAQESPDNPDWMSSSGAPKLAKWGFVPLNTTILLDPSDYYASALAHHHRDKTSQKAEWSRPILESTEWIGKLLNREEIRGQVTRCRATMMRHGISLHL